MLSILNIALFCGYFLLALIPFSKAATDSKRCYATEECQCTYTDPLGYYECYATNGLDMFACGQYEYYYFTGGSLNSINVAATSANQVIPGVPIENSLIVDIEKTNDQADAAVDCQVKVTIGSMNLSNTFHTANGSHQSWSFTATALNYKYTMNRVNCDLKVSARIIPTPCKNCFYMPIECDL